jgi:hypothetical protein
VVTIIKNARAAQPRGRRLFAEASEWVAGDDLSWPFSFVNICDALDLSVSRVRTSIEQLASSVGPEQRDAPNALAPEIVTWVEARRVTG